MQMIKFKCPGCASRYETAERYSGEIWECPRCDGILEVPKVPSPALPAPLAPKPVRRKRRKKQAVVPIGLKMPHGLGGMQAKVTQGTANTMAKTFLGGILVAIGVALAALVGGKGKQA